jgi:glycerate 2-kinase
MLKLPSSLSSLPNGRGEEIHSILEEALIAVDPMEAVRRAVIRQGNTLRVGDRQYDLSKFDRIFVVGGGKAGAPMAAAVEEVLGDRIAAGLVNVKYGHVLPPEKASKRIQVNEAGHPSPDENGRRGVERMFELLTKLTERDLVICVISGGGSALMVLPQPGITLADKQALTASLLRCGATINEMNAVRKHLSAFKGGQLARRCYPAQVISLVLSDVVGNPLDVIASGPTAPDTSTFETAYKVLQDRGIWDEIAPAIRTHIESGLRGEAPETPKVGDPVLANAQNVIVGSNEVAALAAMRRAQALGYHSELLSTYIEGEAREVAKCFAGLAKELIASGRPQPRPACLIAGGETTVNIRGKGLGGRNQELALAGAVALMGWPGVVLVSLATDGTDGPTDAAGALCTGETVARGKERGLAAGEFLVNNDSYHFFEPLGDLLMTGPTNTNVNDLIFVFAL